MSVQDVITQLQQLNTLHTQLLELGKKKKDIIIKNDIDALAKLIQEESKLAKQVAGSEQQWISAAKAVFVSYGIEPEPSLTVSDLLKLIKDEEERGALQQAQSELLVTMHELKQVNALNQQLIEQSLAFIDYTINILAGTTDDVTYGKPSNPQQGHSYRGMFDARA